METSDIGFDVAKFKKTLEDAHSDDNGWDLVYDGVVRHDYPDCAVKVYKGKIDEGNVVISRSEALFRNVKVENYYKMMTDISIMSKCDIPLKQLKIVEKISKNCDVIYMETDLAPPMINRDFLIKRFYVSSQDDADIINKYGLSFGDHKYYIVMQKSVDLPDYPPKEDVVRAETKLSCWLLEEDTQEEGAMKMKTFTAQNLNGQNSASTTNKIGPQNTYLLIGKMLDNYFRHFGK